MAALQAGLKCTVHRAAGGKPLSIHTPRPGRAAFRIYLVANYRPRLAAAPTFLPTFFAGKVCMPLPALLEPAGMTKNLHESNTGHKASHMGPESRTP